MSKDQTPLLGNGSQEFGMLGFGDINTPLTITGPSAEFQIGAYPPRDGEQIKMEAVACLAQAPTNAAAFVTCGPGSSPGTVKVFVWQMAQSGTTPFAVTFPAAAGATVTKIHLIATKGSAVTK